MILAQKIVKLRKTKLGRHSSTFDVPYRFYFGTKNENRDFIEQNRVFHALGEDFGVRLMLSRGSVLKRTPGPGGIF